MEGARVEEGLVEAVAAGEVDSEGEAIAGAGGETGENRSGGVAKDGSGEVLWGALGRTGGVASDNGNSIGAGSRPQALPEAAGARAPVGPEGRGDRGRESSH